MLKIASTQNENFKKFISLTTSKGLKKEKLFLLSGDKLIREFLKTPHLPIMAELMSPTMTSLFPADGWPHDIMHVQFAPALFNELDVVGTHFNLLVLAQPAIDVLGKDEITAYTPRGLELVAPIGDPGNLGALIRSCEAFGVPRVLLTQEAAHPFLPKCIKASAGSVLRIPLSFAPALRDFPDTCLALDMQGASIYDFAWPEHALLIVGEEGHGLGEADTVFQQRLRIPTQGVESLNAIVAASIALAFKAYRRSF